MNYLTTRTGSDIRTTETALYRADGLVASARTDETELVDGLAEVVRLARVLHLADADPTFGDAEAEVAAMALKVELDGMADLRAMTLRGMRAQALAATICGGRDGLRATLGDSTTGRLVATLVESVGGLAL